MKIPSRDVTLTDGKVTLRPYQPGDALNLFTAVRESLTELSTWMPWAHSGYSLKEAQQWLKRKPAEWKDGIDFDFAILDATDSAYQGGCGINRVDHENQGANLGYWIRSKSTGRGLALAATLLLAGWGFKQLGLNRIEIVVATDNKRSLRVAEKAGATREGTLRNRILLRGRPLDAVLFSMVPQDFDNPD